ncbi:MAG: FlaD/FlaE family flagellar protein [Halobacteriales archaeon]|nr:FlaD/FlaE family flagellar protein [Halobacteriales archaeon]
MASSAGTRPYLDDQIQFTQTDTLIQWAKYLGTTFGTAGALCALRYYERLNWITASVRRDVERQIEGLSLDELHSKKYDEPGMLSGPLSGLSGTPFGAHAKSLEFIARIAGDDLEADMLRTRLAQHRADIDLATEVEDDAIPEN